MTMPPDPQPPDDARPPVPGRHRAAAAPAPVAAFPFRRFIPWATTALLTVATAWLVAQNLALRAQNDALRTRERLAELAYATAQNQLAERSFLAETMINDLGTRLRRTRDLAHLQVAALVPTVGGTAATQAIAVWDPVQQAGLLTCEKLPAPADQQDYQIWIVDPAYPQPVNGGVFRPDAAGRAILAFRPGQPVTQAAAFALSVEKQGGVAQPAGPLLLLGKGPGI